MSSSEQKKNKAGRAHALAAWEWFKEAAWLQVLLIVAVVVGLVVAIPFVVQSVVSALNNDDSSFYEAHRINYSTYQKYLNGEDESCNGLIGDGKADGTFSPSSDKEGFVVMFYKTNSSDCTSMQGRIETWYNNFNSKYSKSYGDTLKFYAIQCDWYTPDSEKTADKEGDISAYENAYITLEQQQTVQNQIADVYLDQDDLHKSSSVDEARLNENIITDKNARTLDTPLFLTFTHDNGTKGYTYDVNLSKVIFGMVGSLSNTSDSDVAKNMLDVYNFQIQLR